MHKSMSESRRAPFITTVRSNTTSRTTFKAFFPPILSGNDRSGTHHHTVPPRRSFRSNRNKSYRSPSPLRNAPKKSISPEPIPTWDPNNPNRKQLPKIPPSKATIISRKRRQLRKEVEEISLQKQALLPEIEKVRSSTNNQEQQSRGKHHIIKEDSAVKPKRIEVKPSTHEGEPRRESVPEIATSNKADLGIGVTLWLNKFIHQTRKKSSESKRKAALVNQALENAPSEPEAVANAKSTLLLPRRKSWGDLRRSIVRAKITDAINNKRFDLGDTAYTALRCLGEGGFSTVYEVYDPERNSYALKVVKLHNVSATLKSDLIKEVEFLRMFRKSNHVIHLLKDYRDVREDEDFLYILMEKGECSLAEILQSLTDLKRLTPAKLRFYWEQMLEAMQYVHSHHIVHADIKPANFLLVKGQLKLIDFGFAVSVPPGEETVIRSFLGGTKDYMSPELYSHYIIQDGALDLEAMRDKNVPVRVGFKSDVWALGVVLYQLAYGGIVPFSSVPGGKLGKLQALISPDLPVEFDPIDDPLLLDTMQLCLIKDPKMRPNVSGLLSHPFLKINVTGASYDVTLETKSSLTVELRTSHQENDI